MPVRKPKTFAQQAHAWMASYIREDPFPKIARAEFKSLSEILSVAPRLLGLSDRGTWYWYDPNHSAFDGMMQYRKETLPTLQYANVNIAFAYWDGEVIHPVSLDEVVNGGRAWLCEKYPLRISNQQSEDADQPSSGTT